MRRVAVLLLALLVLASGAVVMASGSTDDPLATLSYISGTWTADVLRKATERVDGKTATTYQAVLDGVQMKQNAYLTRIVGGEGETAGSLDGRYKRGDVITLPTGSGVLLLAGSAMAGYTAGGAMIDVTAGQVAPSGASLTVRHRYLAGESTSAVVTITSDTAVLRLEGTHALSPSASTDYNRLAAALQSVGMFRGTGTGYGSGYDLEVAPTRVVGLVMFLRMLGEEEAALAFTGENPFADTPDWCAPYTAYAYSKGYTKGVGSNASGTLYFGTNNPLTAGEYMTFVLRALGYTDGGETPDFTWSAALERSAALGVLNGAEQRLLRESPFLRAQVAYVSCFALSAPVKGGGGTLMDRLLNAGTLPLSATAALGAVTHLRLV